MDLEITKAKPKEESAHKTGRPIHHRERVDISVSVSGIFDDLDDETMKDVVEKLKDFKEQIERPLWDLGYVRASFKWTISLSSA